MSPLFLDKIMGCTHLMTMRAWVLTSTISGNLKLQFMRIFIKVKMLIDQAPRILQTKTQHHDVICVHTASREIF